MSDETENEVDVIVTVTEDARPEIEALSQRLSVGGLHEASSLPDIGIISGRIAPSIVDRLRAESGVAAVELSQAVQIAPPDADVQ